MSPTKQVNLRSPRPRRACVTARHFGVSEQTGLPVPLLPVTRRQLRLLRQRYGLTRIHKVRDRYQEELRQQRKLRLKAAAAQEAEKKLAAVGMPLEKSPL